MRPDLSRIILDQEKKKLALVERNVRCGEGRVFMYDRNSALPLPCICGRLVPRLLAAN